MPDCFRYGAWPVVCADRRGKMEPMTYRSIMKTIEMVRITALALSLGIVAPVMAGPIEDANAAYQSGDYTKAADILRRLAEQSSAQAQYNLGVMYRNGQGVQQDYTEALKWYRKSAV